MASEEYLIKIQLQIQNDKTLKAFTDQLQKTAKEAPKTSKAVVTAMNQTASSTKRFGSAAQNASYQITDFVIQVQGGVDPIRALSQQLPQLLAGFGAIGAGIGVVTSLMPTLIQLFKGAEQEATKLEDTVISMGTAFKQVDMKSWISEWESLDAAQKQASLSALEYTRVIRKQSLESTTEQLTGGVATSGPTGGTGRMGKAAQLGYKRELEDAAEAAGLTVKQFKAFNEEIQKFQQSGFSDSNSIGAALQILYGAQDPNKANAELAKTVQITEQLNASSKEYQDTQSKNLLQDVEVTAKRLELYQKQSEGVAKAAEAQVSAAAQAAIDANDYKQMLVEVAIAEDELLQKQLELEAAMKKSGEGFGLAEEMLKTFDQSFTTMLDGVLMGTQSLSEGFEDMSKVIIAQLLKLLAYKAVFAGFGLDLSGGTSAFVTSAKGNVFSGGNVVPFAKGGVVNTPTIFPMAKGGMGLMGEAGPEAVMPLTRGKNGNLGVAASPVNVTVNNMASGVKVNARQTESGLTLDVVMDQIGAAIAKGGNPVANALESSYSLGRGRAVY